jgi:hypothetical protein
MALAAQNLTALASLEEAGAQKVNRLRTDPTVDGKHAPWIEKYRPKQLDDVAAHKGIIDTSGFVCTFSAVLWASNQQIAIYCSCSQASDIREQAAAFAFLRATWDWEDLHHPCCGTADLRRFDAGRQTC